MKDMQPLVDSGLDEEQLASLCAAWPGAESSIKWDIEQIYSVGGKMFVARSMIGPDRGRISFRVEPHEFVSLSERDGLMAAPYSGLLFWVSVPDPQRLASVELARFVRRSYELVRAELPPRQRALLGAD